MVYWEGSSGSICSSSLGSDALLQQVDLWEKKGLSQRHIDELARDGDMAAQQVLGLLLELELEGLAAQYPGKRFARRA